MAERRMLSKKIVESDAFLDMPLSAQALYMHLNMAADDDGFISAPKRIQRSCGAKPSDLKALIDKRFILAFDSGVVVIKHWLVHNNIRKDRRQATEYVDEARTLGIKETGAYTLDDNQMTTKWQPNDNQVTDILRANDGIGKDRLGKDSNIYNNTHTRARARGGFPQREYSEETLRRLTK